MDPSQSLGHIGSGHQHRVQNVGIDDLEGDILTFSKLDLARLGLNTEPEGLASQTRPSSLTSMVTGQVRTSQDYSDPNMNGTTQSTNNPYEDSPFWGHLVTSSRGRNTELDDVYQDATESFHDINLAALALPNQEARGRYESPKSFSVSQNRGLPRSRSRYRRSLPTAIKQSIPSSSQRGDLDPLQRWRASPPESEPTSLAAIADALKSTTLRTRTSNSSLRGRRASSRAASATSHGSETDCQSSGSVASRGTQSTRDKIQKNSRVGSRGRQSRSKRNDNVSTDDGKASRRYPCTFCCDMFKTKHDWARHEKSLHLNLEGWMCTPHGGTVQSSENGRDRCAYCNMLEPTRDHLDEHHDGCHSNKTKHIFSRKDHLVQHLRWIHKLQVLPETEDWKIEVSPVVSRCGFCSLSMDTWRQRTEHLAKHFREGLTMESWVGEHGFEPHVAAKVTNAMPPYLIGIESQALVPYSATDHTAQDHIRQLQHESRSSLQLDSNDEFLEGSDGDQAPATFFSVIAQHLARYVRRQMRLGVNPTDLMLQDEARRLVYGSDDPWHQTMAENPAWLAEFRKTYLPNAE